MNTPMKLLCAKARLNAAVYQARAELRSARAGSFLARRELADSERGLRRVHAQMQALEAITREAAAEAALERSAAAWRVDAPSIAEEFRSALPERWRSSAAPVGVSYDTAIAALVGRFGGPDTHRSNDGLRSASWTRDVWTDDRPRVRMACRRFSVNEEYSDRGFARVVIHGEARGSFEMVGSAEVAVIVGVEPSLSWDIENAKLPTNNGDPGPWLPMPTDPLLLVAWRRAQDSELEKWAPWIFDGPATPQALLRTSATPPGLHLAPLDCAVDAVAAMLGVPRAMTVENPNGA